ncbi:hypothetical protein [Herbaspirillum sp. VT-16-41]|uniref:hypothetical protein n=1 Tax=Herbaspirillum sp. VT-16-41 TaxID=1953765 RepID=UPI00143DBF6C
MLDDLAGVVDSIAVALAFANLSALENVRPISSRLSAAPDISPFLDPEAGRAAAMT